ncbi:MAG: DUF3987 domain-containing protein [Bacteroidota bacterium]
MTQLNPIFDDDSNITASDLQSIPGLLSEHEETANPFPVHVFPSPFRELIIETKKALNFPADYTGTAILAAVSVAIGKSAKVRVKNGWFESSALYAALVGNPGAAKSHPIEMCFKVFREMDRVAAKEAEILFQAYDLYMDLPKNEKKNIPKPEKPVIIKTVLDNFTPEILHQRLADNNRGCAVVTDELATFLDLMNNYSKGDQSSIYLSFWSNKPTSIDRVSKPIPLFISHPFLVILGSLQPRLLRRLFPPTKSDSGFLQRFLFAMILNSLKMPITENEIEPVVIDNYNEWLRHYIRDNPAGLNPENNAPDSKLYYWSPEAKAFFYDWQGKNTVEVNQNQDTLVGEMLNKYDIHFIRLAIIMQVMEDYNTNQISLTAATSAALLCDYFIANAMQVIDIIQKPATMDQLPADKQKFYDALPKIFTTAEALEIGFSCELRETAINSFISRTDLFIRVSHGKYAKK